MYTATLKAPTSARMRVMLTRPLALRTLDATRTVAFEPENDVDEWTMVREMTGDLDSEQRGNELHGGGQAAKVGGAEVLEEDMLTENICEVGA